MEILNGIHCAVVGDFPKLSPKNQARERVVGSRIYKLLIETYEFVSEVIKRGQIVVKPDSGIFLQSSEIINDISWEVINTGYWKDVPDDWRYCFGHSSLLSVLILSFSLPQECNVPELLKRMLQILDLGLLMSPPLGGNMMSNLATIIHSHIEPAAGGEIFQSSAKRIKITEIDIDPAVQIDKVDNLNIIDFQENYLKRDIPVVIRDAVSFWPSIEQSSGKSWSLEYLKLVAGYRTVPIEIGSKYTDSSWSQKLMTINEFIDDFILKQDNVTKVAYLAQHELFNQISELRSGFSVPDFCSSSRSENEDDIPVSINAWFGPAGTVSPLHTDPKDNLLVQVFGSKYIRLYHRDIPSDVIYCHESRLLNNTSQVDIENVDEEKFPNFKKYSRNYMSETLLNAGEILFIPKGFWHFVKSTSTSFSISFWWS